MKNSTELEQFRARVAVLEGRADALSIVLHASIIMTEEVLKRHSADILDLIIGPAETHPNRHARVVLLEWAHRLRQVP